MRDIFEVSVPYWGSNYLIEKPEFLGGYIMEFPSPTGVLII